MKRYLKLRTGVGLKGTVTRRLFDTARLLAVRKIISRDLAIAKDEVGDLLDWASKPMFSENFLWRFFYKYFHIDLRVQFVTGVWTNQAISHNLVPTVGKAAIADQVGGTTTSPTTAIAIGTGTDAAAAGDTTLQTEIVADGGERGAASVTNQTTTTAGDTERWIKTFNFTGTIAVTEEGLLDNNAAGGVLLAHQVFSAVNVVNGDSLQITHSLAVTT